MCNSEKSISSSQSQTVLVSAVPEAKQLQSLGQIQISKGSNCLRVQTSDERAQLIRSNKTIMKRNLINSIKTKMFILPMNPKQENLTASSLKDLDSDQHVAFKKMTSLKCVLSIDSQKSFNIEIQQIVQQSFQDQYQFIKKIGQGAHSTVYKSLCKIDNKLYAIKKIKNVSFQNFKKMKNLYRMVKLLQHQNIIKFNQFHFDQQKKTALIVMQYCEFNDLRSEILKRQIAGQIFSKAEILSITNKVASVLQYLHTEGICHRDLKPENILFDKQTGQIKVIDLDVCGVKKNKSQKFDLWTNTGTLLYRAPQSFEIGYTEKADIWSLGTIIYELITGQVPFQTEYEKDFIRKVRNEQVNFDRVQTSKKIKVILRKCLQKDSNKRVSAQQLVGICENKIKSDFDITQTSRFVHNFGLKCQDDSHLDKVCLGRILKHTFQ